MLGGLVSLGLALLTLATLATLLAEQWWIFDLASHFRPHYLVGAALLLLVAALLGARVMALAVVLLALPHGFVVFWQLGGVPAQAEAGASGPALTVTTINVHYRNPHHDRVLAYVGRVQPDIVLLQEIVPAWHGAVEALAVEYPNVAPADWRQGADNVLLSRHPIAAQRRHFPDGRGFDLLDTEILWRGRRIRVVNVHPPYPMSERLWSWQGAHFRAIAGLAAANETPLVVAGDFNSTPWSPRFRRMLQDGGLALAAQSSWWPRTWPAPGGPGPGGGWAPGIPIDHVLVSGHWAVASVQRGAPVGSDHHPVTAILRLTAP